MFESDERVAIKICGITRREDALLCAAAGVEMLGLNFSLKSARCIAPEVAKEIVCAVRAQFLEIRLVGIFVNQELAFVQEIAAQLRLDAVQLHGDETPDFTRALSGIFVIKAFRVGPSFSAAEIAAYPCDAVLLDSWSARSPGGTGETFPW
ncbi:MAG TPA: phosphoribosylanthranilate isomerase, partial [Chthoniobacterales bacterium]